MCEFQFFHVLMSNYGQIKNELGRYGVKFMIMDDHVQMVTENVSRLIALSLNATDNCY